ncbi:MAG: type II secretion system F family protein [Candidatus Brocadiia bacterium]
MAKIALGLINLGIWFAILWFYVAVRRQAARREIFTLYARACVRLQLPLAEAFERARGAPREVGQILEGTALRLHDGMTLAEAVRGRWNCIPGWYTRMLAAGERSGNLGQMLDRLADADSREEDIRMDIFDRFLYPVLILGFLLSLLQILCVFIIPEFRQMMWELDVESPGFEFWLRASAFISKYGFFIYLPLLAFMGALLPLPWGFYWGEIAPLRWIHKGLRLLLPPLGRHYLRSAFARWTTTVSMLLEVGYELPDAVEEAAKIESDRGFARAARKWRQDIENGISLSETLRKTKFVPRSVVWEIASAEGQKELPRIMRENAEQEIKDARRHVETFVKVLIPFFVLGLGIIVGSFAFAFFQIFISIMDSIAI